MSNVLRVGQADIQRKLTLGGGDQLGVLEADLDGYPVLGLVAEALAGVVGPGPGGRGLDGVEGQQTLEVLGERGHGAQLQHSREHQCCLETGAT